LAMLSMRLKRQEHPANLRAGSFLVCTLAYIAKINSLSRPPA